MAHDWDDFRYFLALSRASSTVEAARSLDVTHQTVSRRIAALEARLNMRLVDREGASLRLTSRGQALAERVADMETMSHSITQMARHSGEKVEGRIRITTSDAGIRFLLMPVIDKLMKAYPDIMVDILTSTESLDVASGFVDFAVRFTSSPDEDLIGQKIAPVGMRPTGTRALIEAFDRGVRNSADRQRVPIITFENNPESVPNWVEGAVAPDSPVHRVSHMESLIEFVLRGHGICLLPCFIATQLDSLVQSQAMPIRRPIDLWLLTNAEVRRSEKIRQIRAFLQKELGALASTISGDAVPRALG
ncbi:MAG: LysR family transcriptional regulator [Pseudoruegeria sp.]